MAIIPKPVQKKIQEVKEKHFKELDLSGLDLTEIPTELFELECLDVLSLSRNRLTQIPEAITRLQNLTSLDLSRNRLTQIPEAITRLQNLTSLDLSSNKLIQISEKIAQLQNLTFLDLNYNELAQMPEVITQMQKLNYLDLSRNKLTQISEKIAQLQNLTFLDLNYNELTQIPEAINQLQNLNSLYLNCNKLTQIPEAITQLQKLTHLDLSGNGLTQIPETITHLQNLVYLDLSGNRLTQIPETITHLQNLTSLNLSYNHIENPPPEVVLQGINAIRDYFRQLNTEGKDYLFEAKLLIVGEAGAGKTTLGNKIQNENYQLREEDSTKGIEVIQWRFPMGEGKEFRVNIWDFGGQEVYHATHQFFLTKRSLYTVIADNRKEDANFYYWLNVVELLSDNSPVLIIKNEKQDRKRDINEPQLRGRFNNLKATLATNLATNRGLPDVLREIKHHISSLPHIGAVLPKTWVRVREALENVHATILA